MPLSACLETTEYTIAHVKPSNKCYNEIMISWLEIIISCLLGLYCMYVARGFEDKELGECKKQTNKQTIKLIINKDDHGWRKMTHAIENLRLRFSLCPSATVAGGGGGGVLG